MVNFTSHDILLYINNELSLTKTQAFETALLQDSFLQEQYAVLLESTSKMQTSLLQPSQRVINNIMAYASEMIPSNETV